jgi:hypothetical protein
MGNNGKRVTNCENVSPTYETNGTGDGGRDARKRMLRTKVGSMLCNRLNTMPCVSSLMPLSPSVNSEAWTIYFVTQASKMVHASSFQVRVGAAICSASVGGHGGIHDL